MSKNELSFIAIALLFAFLMFFVYLRPDDSDLKTNLENQNKSVIGHVVSVNRDVRHKPTSEITWDHAKTKSRISNGDSLFSGDKSSAQVKMLDGQEIDLGENSLIRFLSTDDQTVSNLSRGNFRLKIDGTLKIKIKGKETTFEGKSSDVQVYLSGDSKPKLKLISGEVKVLVQKSDSQPAIEHKKNQPDPEVVTPQLPIAMHSEFIELKTNEVTSIDLTSAKEESPQPLSLPTDLPASMSEPLIVEQAFESRNEMPAPPKGSLDSNVVEAVVDKIKSFIDPSNILSTSASQSKSDNEEKKSLDASSLEDVKNEKALATTLIEKPIVELTAKPKITEEPAPKTVKPTIDIRFDIVDLSHVWGVDDFYTYAHPNAVRKTDHPKTMSRKVNLNWCGKNLEKHYAYALKIVSGDSSELLDVRGCRYTLKQIAIGKTEITISGKDDISYKPLTINIPDPSLTTAAPDIVEKTQEVELISGKASAAIHWNKIPEAKSYIIDLSENADFTLSQVKSFYVFKNEFKFEFSHKAQNFLRITSVSQSGALSQFSQVSTVKVRGEATRVPSSVDEGFYLREGLIDLGFGNERSNASQLSIEVLSRAVYSSEQIGHHETSPIYGAVAIRNLNWFKNTGLECVFRLMPTT